MLFRSPHRRPRHPPSRHGRTAKRILQQRVAVPYRDRHDNRADRLVAVLAGPGNPQQGGLEHDLLLRGIEADAVATFHLRVKRCKQHRRVSKGGWLPSTQLVAERAEFPGLKQTFLQFSQQQLS